jgi:serine protease DegQ
MRKFWLLFAQATTIGLAVLFIINTLKPGLLPNAARNGVVTLYENLPGSSNAIPTASFSVLMMKSTAKPIVVACANRSQNLRMV